MSHGDGALGSAALLQPQLAADDGAATRIDPEGAPGGNLGLEGQALDEGGVRAQPQAAPGRWTASLPPVISRTAPVT